MSCIPIQDFSLISLCDATKAGKLYSIVPDSGAGDFDVVRATTATYLGSDGLLKTAANDEPRIEFNADGSYKGLLVEPAATNLLLRSEEFDDAYWAKTNATITANNAVAPDGATTADKLVPDTSDAVHSVSRGAQPIGGGFYSVFAKADGYEWILLTSHSSSQSEQRGAFFNVKDGTIGATGDGINAQIEDYGNGWYRCSISEGITPSSIWTVISTNADNVRRFEGNGTDGVLIWGAQNEQGSVPTSYIPTVASTVTRAADEISKTGASALIGQTEGTLFVDFEELNYGDFPFTVYFRITDGSNNNRLRIIRGTNINTIRVIYQLNGNVNQFDLDNIPVNIGQRNKVAFVYKSGDIVVVVNGDIIGTSTNVLTISNTLSFLELSNSNNDTPFKVKTVLLSKTRLSNAELEALTTI